ncbi:hypothetical protein M2165_000057 [Variovorax sp. TBS-050B]|uniref:hypothetical protein n=1 Tax=Variovorax sp. TBS-050B TaxID=2940551 RepID=UPI0024752AFE|nr:hypothetical protein [Variovorax sp. TBS-050B]MDH6590168.1 hypothetical protein [Variovorax sp. TBS-050B]
MSKEVCLFAGAELIAEIGAVQRRVAVGDCIAVRVLHGDGLLEDVLLGGNDAEQQAALALLHRTIRADRRAEGLPA